MGKSEKMYTSALSAIVSILAVGCTVGSDEAAGGVVTWLNVSPLSSMLSCWYVRNIFYSVSVYVTVNMHAGCASLGCEWHVHFS